MSNSKSGLHAVFLLGVDEHLRDEIDGEEVGPFRDLLGVTVGN